MNIFNKITLQSMKKNRSRTTVTVIGVILSAAMITAVATFGVSLLNYMVKGSIEKYGGWHVAFLDIDAAFLEERTNDNEVASTAAFENIGYAILEDGKSPEKPYLFIAGFNEDTFDALPITLISGRLPENSREILIPAHVAAKGGVRFQVGDTLRLAVGNRMAGNQNLTQHDPYHSEETPEKSKEVLAIESEQTYTVVGICARPGFEEHSAPGYTLITKNSTETPKNSFSIFITLKNPHSVRVYAGNISGNQASVYNDNVLRFMGVSENKLFNTLLYSVGGILVAIIMVGSIFLIYNSFSISLNERTHQFGLLSSVGATAKQLRNSVLFEGLCIGALGIPLGIIAGIGSMGLLLPVISEKFAAILYTSKPLTLSLSFPAIAAATAVSMVTILISAYIPAHKATNRPVMESIRNTNEIKAEAKTLKTSKLAAHFYSLEATLALKNFKRNRKRYRSIVLSLVLSVVLFVSGNTFGTTLVRLTEQYTVAMDYDILFQPQDMNDNELFQLYNKLKAAEGVYESSYQTILSYSATVQAKDFSDSYRNYKGYTTEETVHLPIDIQFIEDSKYQRFLEELGLPSEEYAGEGAKMIACAKQRVDHKDRARELFDLFTNPSISLLVTPETKPNPTAVQGQLIDITFVDTYPVDPPQKQSAGPQQNPGVFMVVAPYSLKENFETTETTKTIEIGFLSNNPSQSVAEMEAIIQSSGVASEYTLYNVYEILQQYHSITFVVDIFTYVFVIMISLIAVANVFNTISTNIRLRRRELAMLRSVGMSNQDFNKMMNFECIFYGIRTLQFSLPIAGIVSWLVFKGITAAEKIDNFHFKFPWASMALSIVGVFFIVFITMLYAAGKIKKENIIDALRDDIA